MFIPDRVLHGRPMTTENAKSRFTGKPVHNVYGTGRMESPNMMQDSTRLDDASNKYAFSDREDGLSNQYKPFEQGDMQPKYGSPLKPNLNIPIHQLNKPIDASAQREL